MQKLFIVNPDYGMTEAAMEARCALLRPYAGPDFELEMRCLEKTRVTLDSALDAALAAPEIISLVVDAAGRGAAAAVIYCFSDPALAACREAVAIPVVGAGEAACLTARLITRQAGLILADSRRLPEKREFLRRSGYSSFITAAAGLKERLADPFCERERSLALLEAAGRELVEASGVQALILGCLSFLGQAGPLARRLGLPVVDPCAAAVSLAAGLARQGLRSSAAAYPEPPGGLCLGCLNVSCQDFRL